ncbi:acyltransferase [Gammaproteobacteria bacterium]|nr:acyltransferase [Gammaproteobacteria bacterium]
MQLIFDHNMFRHINDSAEREHGRSSRILKFIEIALGVSVLTYPLAVIERIMGFFLALPIPIYSSIVYSLITSARGLPYMRGMYFRALYYRQKLGYMGPNVFIDQNVFFAYPKSVSLAEFSYIDKNVIIMSKTASVGRRVHIAPRVFISGGGSFEIEDYACIATNSNIITSTEVLKDGARCSGPMVSASQRNLLRSRIIIKKDAFIGANATLLPGVIIAEGSVIGAGVTITKSTDAWGIYLCTKAQKVADRDEVSWPDD